MSKEIKIASKIEFPKAERSGNFTRKQQPCKDPQEEISEQLYQIQKALESPMYEEELELLEEKARDLYESVKQYRRFILELKKEENHALTPKEGAELLESLTDFASNIYETLSVVYDKILMQISHYATVADDMGHEIPVMDTAVKIAVCDREFMVQTPLVKSRYQSYYTSEGNTFPKDYTMGIASLVKKKMEQYWDRIGDYEYKTIEVIEVMNSQTSFLPDGDNLDTKKIIDSITWNFSTKDASPYTTFIFSVMVNRDIPEGTYFLVSEEDREWRKAEYGMERIEEIYRKLR